MTDRDIAWAVINADPDYMDGASGDAASRYVGGLEREVKSMRDLWTGLTESPEEVIQRNTELTTEVEALRAQVLAVRELHAAKDCGCCCAECPDGWPCNTIRILDGGDA